MSSHVEPEDLLRGPVACVFLLAVESSGLPLELAASPLYAFAFAARAFSVLNPWSGHHREVIREVLARAQPLDSTARALLSAPAADWWTAPADLDAQVWRHPAETPWTPPTPAVGRAPTEWEAYAQRPIDWRWTSTVRAGLSSLDATIAAGVGDWPADELLLRSHVAVRGAPRILEIVGADDWHFLASGFPVLTRDGPAGAGSLSPDWGSVALHWDAVHLTFAGLLTAPFVRVASAEGESMLWSWDSEGTLWLNAANDASVSAAGPPSLLPR